MAQQDETIRLILETMGRQGVEALAAAAGNTRAKLEELKATYHKGGMSADEYSRQAQKFASQMQSQAGLLDKLKTAQDGAGKSAANMGRSMLEFGRIAQDFSQGGFAGIINNIEGMATAMGGGPGLAGVMTIVGTAAMLAKPKIEAFFKSLSSDQASAVSSVVGEVEKRLKDLTKISVRSVFAQTIDAILIFPPPLFRPLREAQSIPNSRRLLTENRSSK